jgi:exopolysaccharide biosynthesis protein
MKHTRNRFAILFGFVLFLFTGYLLADAFLIPRAYAVVTDAEEATTAAAPTTAETVEITAASLTVETTAAPATEEPEATEPIQTETSYADGNILVELGTYRLLDTTVYVADVQLSSPEYLKTAFADSTYGRNVTEKTSTIASSVDAILAVNGDYYGAQRSGYVIRNGVLYRSQSGGGEDLVIYADGSFGIVSENEVTAESLIENGAWNVLSFGPALIENGVVSVSENDEVGRAMASNPRTAIGVVDDLHYVFVVSDGRTGASEGLSLYELALFMESLGVQTAYNLDGGGSSSMVFLGNLVNEPVNGRRSSERSVSDIVYIGYNA